MPKTTQAGVEARRRYNDRVYSRVFAELPKETVDAFKAKCQHDGVSQASVIKEAIEKFISDEK